MSRLVAGLVVVTSLSIGFVAGSSTSADAHTISTYYVREWPNQTIDMGIGQNGYVPAVTFGVLASNVVWAGNVWDNVPDAHTWGNFSALITNDPSLGFVGGCAVPATADVWIVRANNTQISATANGATQNCVVGNTIISSRVAMRINPPDGTMVWTHDQGLPPGNTNTGTVKYFVGTLVHELGHVTGFGSGPADDHFVQGSSICNDHPHIYSDSTMCPGPPVRHSNWYSTTLSAHDMHTFAGAY